MTSGTKSGGSMNPLDGGLAYARTWSGADRTPGSGTSEDHPYSSTAWSRRIEVGSRAKDVNCRWTPPPYVLVCDKVCGDPAYLTYPDCETSTSDKWDDNDELALLGRLTGAIRKSDFNAGVALGTLGQVYGQTRSTLAAIGKSLVALKRGQVLPALRALGLSPGQRKVSEINRKLSSKDISGAWLAMQYGWLPTLSDIHEGWTAFSEVNALRTITYVVQHRRPVFSWNGSASPTRYVCDNKLIESKRLKYTLTESPSTQALLGLTDPLSVAWELVPWSFAVDWFTPIGSYLDALSMIPKLEGKWVATKRSIILRESGAILDPSLKHCYFGAYKGRSTTISRTVGTVLSVPLPTMKPLNKAFSSGHIKNAIALLHQQLR